MQFTGFLVLLSMLYTQLFVSILLIFFGVIVKKYPHLIAGYGQLSNIEKEKIDINGLSNFLRFILIGLGVLTLIIYGVLNYFHVNENYILLCNATITVIGIVTAAIVASTKFKM